MTLRIMLIGLVASLGFEPSSGPDFSRWAQAGAEWVRARALDHSGPAGGAKADRLASTDCHQVAAEVEEPTCDRGMDAAFAAASEGLVGDLVADLREAGPADEAEAVLGFEPPVSTGLPEGEEVARVASANVEVSAEVEDMDAEASAVDAEVETSDEDATGATIGPECRHDDLSAAVRLTRDAIQAWASLVQQSADECQVTR